MAGPNMDITDERDALIASLKSQQIQQEKRIEQLQQIVRI